MLLLINVQTEKKFILIFFVSRSNGEFVMQHVKGEQHGEKDWRNSSYVAHGNGIELWFKGSIHSFMWLFRNN